ncbi:3-ketoacyl-ACP reductase [Ammoniphilus oxalaticus]|uniref:3-ketoacyl-ACP reductase n=1 Tax=Ammoniphilus oxalaticus TaxID=66863 RepID=A0A419SJS9_9BACL|nr:SDR family oxidoreductase [Ammoniphilus oxalaticus]RKD24291.1 3-ketoacyl-ACP reductase [Ammoniphilus oxalaticus]
MEKWALVTGASGGIGAAIAVALANKGYDLYLHYYSGEAQIDKLVIECEQKGSCAIPIQANLARVEEIECLRERMPRSPDVLINNAGLTHYGIFTDTSMEEIDLLYAVNARAAFLLAQLFVPSMIKRGFGRIVNISSIWGTTGASCEVLYSMTKGALLSFTKALAKEVAPSGITVNAVAPGAVAGPLLNRQFSANELEEIAAEIPMGRLGQPSEIASLVCFLISDEAAYITGQELSPNGGWHT